MLVDDIIKSSSTSASSGRLVDQILTNPDSLYREYSQRRKESRNADLENRIKDALQVYNDTQTKGYTGFFNRINRALGFGVTQPTLINESPEYTQFRQQDEQQQQARREKPLVDSILEAGDSAAQAFTFGARNLLRDATQAVHYQLVGKDEISKIEEQNQQYISTLQKQLRKKGITEEQRRQILQNINTASQDVTKQIYDFASKSNLQIAGEAIGSFADVLTWGASSAAMKSAAKTGSFIEFGKFLASKEGAKYLAEEAVRGATQFGVGGLGMAMQEKQPFDQYAGTITKSAGIGAIAQPALSSVFGLLGVASAKLAISKEAKKVISEMEKDLGKLSDEETAIVKDYVGRGFKGKVLKEMINDDINFRRGPTSTENAYRPTDYIANRPDIEVVRTNNIGKNAESKEIPARFEWNPETKTGKLLVSPDASEAVISHEIGHYLEKIDNTITEQFFDEITQIAGKKLNANERLAEAVSRILTDGEMRSVAPRLAAKLEEFGLALPEPKGSVDAKALSSKISNSLEKTPERATDKPGRLTEPDGFSFKEARTGLAENGQYLKDRIVIGKNDAGDIVLEDGTHLLEAYRRIGKNVPKDKIQLKDGVTLDELGITRTPEAKIANEHAREVIDYIKKNGGVTLSLKDGSFVEKGYAFSIMDKADEIRLTMDDNLAITFKRTFNQLKEKYGDDPNAHFGGWVDNEELVVDVSNVTTDLKQSLYDAIIKKQDAIGSLERYSKGEDGTIYITESLIRSLEPLSGRSLGKGKSSFQDWGEAVAYYTKKNFKNSEEVTSFLKESEAFKPAKKTATKKETVQALPEAVKNSVKSKYKKSVSRGRTKEDAVTEVVATAKKYEKGVEVAAKETPVIQTVVENRRGVAPYSLGDAPKAKVGTEGINWSHVKTSEDTESLLRMAYEQNKEFKSVRPSRTNKDIQEGFRAIGIDEKRMDEFLKYMPNANVAVKLKQMMVDSASDLMNYMKTAKMDNAADGIMEGFTKEQQLIIKDKWLRTQVLAKNFSGLRTEASHLLRSFGIDTFEGENFTQMSELLTQALGESGGDTLKFIRKTTELTKPTIADKYLAIWYNFILSGWKTWGKNAIDNTAYLTTESLSRVATNPLEGARFVANLLRAFPGAVTKAGRILAGKEISANKFSYSKRMEPYFKNPKTNFFLTELSGRVLDSADTFQSTMVKTAEKHLSSFEKQMKAAGINDADLIAKTNEAVLTHYGKRLTLQTESISPLSKYIPRITNESKLLKFIVPFVRVVSNAISRKVDYIPILNLYRTFGKNFDKKEVQVILKHSDIPQGQWDRVAPIIQARLHRQQLGRFYLGMLASVGAFSLAQSGRLSGNGPTNKDEKRQLEATGWRANSVKIGDRWIGYQYFGPLSGVLSVAGSINDAIKYDRKQMDIGSQLANGIVGFAKTTLSMSYLSGVSDLINLIDGMISPSEYAAKQLIGMMPIPNMIPQVAYTIDRVQRDQKSDTFGGLLKNTIQYRMGLGGNAGPIFGLKELPPRYDAFGEAITSDLIYGVTGATEKQNLARELTDLKLVLPVPDKRTKIGDNELTREQLVFFTATRGNILQKNKGPMMRDIRAKKTAEERENEFKRWMDKINVAAKEDTAKQYNLKTKSPIEKSIEERLNRRFSVPINITR